MDFDKFIDSCKEKYSKYGVTSVLISTEDNDCHIMLGGRNNYDENSNAEFIGITREEVNSMYVSHADIHVKMPINEGEVFRLLDDWFDRASKMPPVIVKGINGDLPTRLNPNWKVTNTTKCNVCSAPLEDDNIYGICTLCYTSQQERIDNLIRVHAPRQENQELIKCEIAECEECHKLLQEKAYLLCGDCYKPSTKQNISNGKN